LTGHFILVGDFQDVYAGKSKKLIENKLDDTVLFMVVEGR
jgi:hypothetical protein